MEEEGLGVGLVGKEEREGEVIACADARTDLIKVTASVVLRGSRVARPEDAAAAAACCELGDAGDDAMSSLRTSSTTVRRSFASCRHLSRKLLSVPCALVCKVIRRVMRLAEIASKFPLICA